MTSSLTSDTRCLIAGTQPWYCTNGRLVALVCGLCLVACSPSGHEHHPHGDGTGSHHDAPDHAENTWSITAWGQHFEIYPEVESLVVGQSATAHVHVTRLADYSPLATGAVEMVLVTTHGEQVFRSETATQPGIYTLQVQPTAQGEAELRFRIHGAELVEEIRGGRVRIGTSAQPGTLLVAPAPKGGSGGQPLSFLKEEQWRGALATSWVRRGELQLGIHGLAHVRAPAGGEVVLSSPLEGVVQSAVAWPFPGQAVRRGQTLFRVAPRVAAQRSLAALEAEAASLAIEKDAALQRLARLEELLHMKAASQREVEELEHEARSLEQQHLAALRDLHGARLSRQAGTRLQRAGSQAAADLPPGSAPAGEGSATTTAAETVLIRAPFAGEIAQVPATPGATVAAGEALARLVKTDLVWLELALSPTDAMLLSQQSVRGVVLSQGPRATWTVEDGVRLVAVAPELTPSTGTVQALIECPSVEGLILGASVQGQLLLNQSESGIVIPSTALVDDAGVSVVYLQLAGERFLRQEVQVLRRQGDQVLVAGLEPGQRLVHSGGNSIRRSSLLSSGETHGHVH